MSSANVQQLSADLSAKRAVEAVFERLACLVDHDTVGRACLMAAQELLLEDHSPSTWGGVASALHMHLVKTGMASIDSLGLMPRRARVSLSEVSSTVLEALETGQPAVQAAAQRCARLSSQAFFSWALSGVGALPAIALYVVGLPAEAAAHRIKEEGDIVRGPAMRTRRMAEINAATKDAREAAAAALVVELVALIEDVLRSHPMAAISSPASSDLRREIAAT